MRSWKDFTLKTKMFITFTIVSLFLVSLTCIIFYIKNMSDIQNQTTSLSNTISRQFSRATELYIQDIEKLSLSIFSDSIIQSNLVTHYKTKDPLEQNDIQRSINDRLFNHALPRKDVQSIHILALDGDNYSIYKGKSLEQNYFLIDENWYVSGEANRKKFILLPTAEENTLSREKEKVITMVRRINQIPTRDSIGYMKININVNEFNQFLVSSNKSELERQMRVMIIDDKGHVIYDNENVMAGMKALDLDTSVLNSRNESGELQWGGDHYWYTFENSAYTGWNTIVLIPTDFILTKQQRFLYIVIIIGLLATFLIAIVSYILSHHITLPLRYMMKKMNRVELGDFSQRMEFVGNNEIGRLSHIYNNMLDSISRLIHEVYDSKLAEKNAQLSALQAQINPHFLYNTLNIMKSISRIKGVEEVAEMSESLAELFQYSMKNMQHPVSLKDEMDHVHNYMNIQQHRFSDRFEWKSDIPEELLEASVLKLTIQPLVENAINHGLGRMKSGGVINISARTIDNHLVIDVQDNGKGIDEKELMVLQHMLEHPNQNRELDDHHQGIGLLNIQQRIRLYHGHPFGIEVRSPSGNGTIVKLKFPFIIHAFGEGDEAR